METSIAFTLAAGIFQVQERRDRTEQELRRGIHRNRGTPLPSPLFGTMISKISELLANFFLCMTALVTLPEGGVFVRFAHESTSQRINYGRRREQLSDGLKAQHDVEILADSWFGLCQSIPHPGTDLTSRYRPAYFND